MLRRQRAAGLVAMGCLLALSGLSFACTPSASPATPVATADPFTVVRATAQTAYQTGKDLVDRGDILRGCPLIDQAKTNDPDNRPEIEAALEQCLTAIAQATPPQSPTSPPRAGSLPTAAVGVASTAVAAGATALAGAPGGGNATATALTNIVRAASTAAAGSGLRGSGAATATPAPAVGAGTGTGAGAGAGTAAGAGPPATALPGAIGGAGQAGTTAQPTLAGTGVGQTGAGAAQAGAATAQTGAAVATALVGYQDLQARFTLGTPPDWGRLDQPAVLFGSGLVEFRDASGRAGLSVAVDSNGRAISPELYAASMELNMQQQVPGYALESVMPGTTASNPSITRTFTFTQRDSTGADVNMRAFQVAVLKGQTPYIITGSARADQFASFEPTFDRMVESFRFS